MIKNFIITGDVHGKMNERIKNILETLEIQNRNETAVIVLGDAGLNFYCNKSEEKRKKALSQYGLRIYCVRGNHEERPENLGFKLEYDEDVKNEVYIDPINNDIRYFKDGGEYEINGHPTLVIGGAYSIDKYYRLRRAALNKESFSGWFKDEQLTKAEMKEISDKVKGKSFDFVFSHTCPISWEPNDLFLSMIDQSKVDKSMEIWLDELKDTFNWKIWNFGHFHSDRIERPRVEQYYHYFENMETIWNRWEGEKTFEKEWWLPKSPNFYMDYEKSWNPSKTKESKPKEKEGGGER